MHVHFCHKFLIEYVTICNLIKVLQCVIKQGNCNACDKNIKQQILIPTKGFRFLGIPNEYTRTSYFCQCNYFYFIFNAMTNRFQLFLCYM